MIQQERIQSWANDRIKDVQENGVGAIRRAIGDVYGKVAKDVLLQLRPNYGEQIHERDWDVLLVLDACRYDLFTEIIERYNYIENVEPFYSAGGSSKQWMEANFGPDSPEYLSKTAMITGNPFSAETLDPNTFQELDEVWRYAWSEELQTIRARPITDRVIHTSRNEDCERIIAHYMQPHALFIPRQDLSSYTGPFERSIWRAIQRGRVSKEEVWQGYRENLTYVLDEVELLLQNLDAERVVITSDHGNALGEWGFYGHNGAPIEAVRKVPWASVTAEDTGSYTPTTEKPDKLGESDVNSRLSDLGYIESKRGEKANN